MHVCQQPTTGLLLSGGLDSAVLLDQLLQRGARVVPLYVRTGCAWERCELDAVEQFLAALGHPHVAERVVLDLPVEDLYGQHWSISGTHVPDEASADEDVFLPGRNPLLLIKPALWCQMHAIGQLALATLAANPFDDATPEFFARFEGMIGQSTGWRLQILRPFDRLAKHRVLALGRHLPLELTFSCLAPSARLHCGRCNKCAERRRAFQRVGMADPTRYSEAGAAPAAAAHTGKRPA